MDQCPCYKKYQGRRSVEIIAAPRPNLEFLVGLKVIPISFVINAGKTLYRVSKTKIIEALKRLKRFAEIEIIEKMKEAFITLIKDTHCAVCRKSQAVA